MVLPSWHINNYRSSRFIWVILTLEILRENQNLKKALFGEKTSGNKLRMFFVQFSLWIQPWKKNFLFYQKNIFFNHYLRAKFKCRFNHVFSRSNVLRTWWKATVPLIFCSLLCWMLSHRARYGNYFGKKQEQQERTRLETEATSKFRGKGAAFDRTQILSHSFHFLFELSFW